MANQLFLVDIDLKNNQLQNATIHPSGTAPTSPSVGQAWYDSNSGVLKLKTWNGTAWETVNSNTSGTFPNGTITSTAVTPPTSGITVNASSTVQSYSSGAASFTFALANDLGAVEGLSTTGVAVRTATDTWATRTITGTTNRVTVTNGDGVAGNPTLTLPQDIHTSASPTFTNVTISSMGSASTDAATKSYVDTLIQGLKWKQSVRAATSASGTLATSFAAGQSIDSGTVTLIAGDRILIKDQAGANQPENGIYTVNATGAPTRAVDADTWTELVNATCYVEAGNLADTAWTCVNDQGGSIGGTPVAFVMMGSSGTATTITVNPTNITVTDYHLMAAIGTGASKSLAQGPVYSAQAGILTTNVNGTATNVTGTVAVANGGTGYTSGYITRKVTGDCTAAASQNFTHSLGLTVITDLHVQVYEKATPYRQIIVGVQAIDANTVQINFNTAPTAAQYRIVVIG